jgi:N-acetylmuramoyl-L-alanine amidase
VDYVESVSSSEINPAGPSARFLGGETLAGYFQRAHKYRYRYRSTSGIALSGPLPVLCFWLIFCLLLTPSGVSRASGGAGGSTPKPSDILIASAPRTSKEGKLTAIKWESDRNGQPKVTITASIPVSYSVKVFDKTQDRPYRIAVDLDGVLPGTVKSTIPVDEGVLMRIRVGIMSSSPAKTRVVLDLFSPVEYNVERNSNACIIHLGNPEPLGADVSQVTGISWERQNGGTVLKIHGTGSLSYKTMRLSGPDRFVIDVQNATFSSAVPSLIEGNGTGVLRVRTGQFQNNPPIARIVLDIDEKYRAAGQPGPSFLNCDAVKTDSGLVVYFPSRITSVTQSTVKDKSVLTILTTGPVEAVVKTGVAIAEGAVPGILTPEETPKNITPEGVLPGEAGKGELHEYGTCLTVEIPFADIGKPAVDFDIQALGPGAVGRVYAEEVRHSPVGVRLLIWLNGSVAAPFNVLSNGRDGSIVLEFTRSQVLRGKRIILDPGHGGNDPGCISYSGLYEKDLTISVAKRLAPKLEGSAAQVIMTRSGDDTIDVYKRTALANYAGGDIFVSLHMNSFRTSQKSGVEVYYYSNAAQAKRLATAVHARLLEKTGFSDSGVRIAQFVVLRGTSMPAVLCEMGYLSNPDNERFLINEGFHEILAEALYQGICDYFGRSTVSQGLPD